MAQRITKSSEDIVKAALAVVSAISAEETMSPVDWPNHVFVHPKDGTEQANAGIDAFVENDRCQSGPAINTLKLPVKLQKNATD